MGENSFAWDEVVYKVQHFLTGERVVVHALKDECEVEKLIDKFPTDNRSGLISYRTRDSYVAFNPKHVQCTLIHSDCNLAVTQCPEDYTLEILFEDIREPVVIPMDDEYGLDGEFSEMQQIIENGLTGDIVGKTVISENPHGGLAFIPLEHVLIISAPLLNFSPSI